MYYQNLQGTTKKSFRIGKNGNTIVTKDDNVAITKSDGTTLTKIEVSNIIIDEKDLLDSEGRVTRAVSADSAINAIYATDSTNATNAENAKNATNADYATKAGHADSATTATTAENGVSTEQVNYWNGKAEKGKQFLFTLEPGNWAGNSKAWTYTIWDFTEITALTQILVSPQSDMTAAEIEAYQNANLQDGGQGSHYITLKAVCDEKPASQIKIRVIAGPELKS